MNNNLASAPETHSGSEDYPIPGPGAWVLEMLHWMDPTSEYMTEVYPVTMPEGMRRGSARYGLLLDSLDMAFVNSFLYVRSRGVGAPVSATRPPPRWLFKVIAALHPEIRRRVASADRVFADKIWRREAQQWREIDKPATLKQGALLQGVNPQQLDAAELIGHLQECDAFVRETIIRHHELVFCVVIPLMDFVAHVQEWTGAGPSEIFPLFQGASPHSSDAVEELAAIQVAADDAARQLLRQNLPAGELLAAIRIGDSPFAKAIDSYLMRVGYRLLNGYDVSHKYALEVPEVLLRAINQSLHEVAGSFSQQTSEALLKSLRDRVPTAHQPTFDELFAEARDTYGIRDDRIFVGDAWATGLMRRAILAAGQRLVDRGALESAEQLVDARLVEMIDLLNGGEGLGKQVAQRYRKRIVRHVNQAPPWLGAEPVPPPPLDWLPKRARRVGRALDGYMNNLFESEQPGSAATARPDKALSELQLLRGAGAGPGVYEGVARIVKSADDLAKVISGDVVITVSTSPAFNVILPLAGALVTDRGGLLSHAAIVAREYGIPAVVGARGATAQFKDGDRVQVNGDSGMVTARPSLD